ncbi:MAG: hypothetical protein ACREMY_21930, partial [bacterium]
HCRVCHVTFDDDIMFDAHRRIGICLDPRSLGLSSSAVSGVGC